MSDAWTKPQSLHDLADQIANSLDDNDMSQAGQDADDTDTSGNAAVNNGVQPVSWDPTQSANPNPSTNPDHVNAFFNDHYDQISQLANDMNLPVNYLLALSASESNWGRPVGKNNLFGTSDANGHPNDYDSFDDSLNAFRNSQWYSRLQDIKSPAEFANELVNNSGGKLKYNSVNSNYDKDTLKMIDTINRRLPIWQQPQ